MALRCGLAYVIVGLALSVTQNLIGLLRGGLSAFAWTGSLADQARLVWWWFAVPALTWPVDLYWTLYHAPIW